MSGSSLDGPSTVPAGAPLPSMPDPTSGVDTSADSVSVVSGASSDEQLTTAAAQASATEIFVIRDTPHIGRVL
jgi:hypothetical protein